MSRDHVAPAAPSAKAAIPLSAPCIHGNAWAYVKDCLDTSWVSSVGSYVNRFEELVATRAGARYAVATVNGTSALHIALLVAGVAPGDEVLVSSLTFIAPANAIRYAGAWPVFVDAEPRYLQMDAGLVKRFVERECERVGGRLRNRATGRCVGAILPVHVLGHPVDMDPVLALGREYGLPVIEDASEGMGAHYRDRHVGGLGDIGCFSFNGNKIVTTGGGGMIVTDNDEWAAKARYLTTQAKDDPLEYVHGTIGYNYRLTNVLAALGCAQMEQLDEFVERKRRIAARYTQALGDVPGLRLPEEADWAFSTFWLYTVLIDEEVCRIDSRVVLRRLDAQGIQTRPLWQPIHRSPAHEVADRECCPVADDLHRRALSLPCSVGLTPADQDRVIDAVRQAVSRA